MSQDDAHGHDEGRVRPQPHRLSEGQGDRHIPSYGPNPEEDLGYPSYGQGDEAYGVPTGYYAGQDATASMGKRALARMVDLLMVSVVAVPLGLALRGDRSMTQTASVVLLGLAIGLVWIIYDVALVAVLGRTAGMMVLRLRVCNEASGQKLNLAAALVRALVSHSLWLVGLGFFTLLIYLSPFFDSSGRRQGWHDKLARDVVIND